MRIFIPFIFTVLTNQGTEDIMETKKGDFVSVVKDRIIQASIESLREEGLKFSVDSLAGKLKISKKTVYKYFPDKEALATALYETYYSCAAEQAKVLIAENTEASHKELLRLYFDSKRMARSDVFNKYALNQKVLAYTQEQGDALWEMVSLSFYGENTQADKDALRVIVDGSFEKLCGSCTDPESVIERMMTLLW